MQAALQSVCAKYASTFIWFATVQFERQPTYYNLYIYPLKILSEEFWIWDVWVWMVSPTTTTTTTHFVKYRWRWHRWSLRDWATQNLVQLVYVHDQVAENQSAPWVIQSRNLAVEFDWQLAFCQRLKHKLPLLLFENDMVHSSFTLKKAVNHNIPQNNLLFIIQMKLFCCHSLLGAASDLEWSDW